MSASDDRARQSQDEVLTELKDLAAKAIECAARLQSISTSLWCGSIKGAAEQLKFHLEWFERQEAIAAEEKRLLDAETKGSA